MGIPKFFRYISERYPLTSQLIQENKIPEFDNLYLDFNGIIHNCSHPNDDDAHFRLTEEQMFTSIFTYVDQLFGKIKPKKLFFMAVDGVAPRAKMNQQRSRRFRTAKEVKDVREKAESRGEELPKEKAFDSNCITPGTEFMVKLSKQLKYFVNKKITEDADWRDVEVVLSGHEVPGEGEHKIMEYIRLSKAQPDYNPNTRHCMYGLDADLIMLSLLSHDPHFCLLREEVKFGPVRKSKGAKTPDSTNFYLLHLTLMREYLDLEFRDIEPVLPFDYSLERVIDDFVLLAVFVGNDFLPNLPDLHIHENGLERLFEVYKKVLPGLDGYINESGTINMKRLQVVLDQMAAWEQEVFEKEYADLNWYKGKQAKHVKEMELARKRAQLVLTTPQREIFEKVKAFVLQYRSASPAAIANASLTMVNDFPARERKFVTELAADLRLSITWDEYDEQDRNLVTWRLPGAGEEPIPETEKTKSGENVESAEAEWEDVEEEESSEDEEALEAVNRVLKKYEKARVMKEDGEDDFDARYEQSIREKMDEWKRGYYQGKLEISYDDPQGMGDLIYCYVEGLQWVMHYYYSGVASWGWFYRYHYAPRISDLRGVSEFTFEFELGKPFLPFEQLMGVLPEASKELIPKAYHELMYDPTSPIIDFYPQEFEQDMNGKKAEWEAIVKIPFIDEKRLLAAMASREHRLTAEEKQRNTWGPSTKFIYNPSSPVEYPSSLPGFFPPLYRCMCRMENFDLPVLDGLHLVEGLCDGVKLGVHALAGFPSLKTLPHTAALGFHGVNVHGSESRNKSMVVHIAQPARGSPEEVARALIGARVHVGWPFLQEGKVVAVSDALFKYEKAAMVAGGVQKVHKNPHSQHGLGHWKMKADGFEQFYSKRCGVVTGDVEMLVHVRPLRGLRRTDDGALVKDYEGPDKEKEHALQMTLSDVASEDPRFIERAPPPLSEEFPEGSKVFFLGEHAYGVAAQVSATTDTSLSVILAFFPSDKAENEQFKGVVKNRSATKYFPSFRVAEILQISPRALSKITSSFMVITSDHQKTNLGLSLKFEAKALKVVGYSRRDARFWEFSEKAVDIIREYRDTYPEIFGELNQSGDQMSRATDVFPGDDKAADAKVKEVRTWLAKKGVKDFEPVSLFCDQLDKSSVAEIQALQDSFQQSRSAGAIKKAIVKGIPRQAVIKPAHAVYRLQNQHFALGDRVTMVRDSGGVPLSVKGVVIGLNPKSMDVVWDVPFMAGTTLGDRCATYRGSTVEFNSCLNLTDPQYIASTNPKVPTQPNTNPAFKPRFGPHPAIQPAPGQQAAAGFRPAASGQVQGVPVHIMANPNRGRGGFANANARGGGVNGHGRGGASPVIPANGHATNVDAPAPAAAEANGHAPAPSRGRGGFVPRGGVPPRGGGGFVPGFRGRGFNPNFVDRGRGFVPRGGYRGRGRGASAAVPS